MVKTLYELEGQEKAIVDKINKTHKQLSPIAIFMLSASLGWKIGLFIITTRDYGKSILLKTIARMSPYSVVKIASATPAGFKYKHYDELLSNNKSLVITDDIATVCVGGHYIIEEYLVFLSQLIFDEAYDGGTTRQASIENAKVVVLAATTPGTFEGVMRSPSWQESCCERFYRIYPFYLNNPHETIEKEPNIPLHNHFPERLDWKVSKEKFKEVYKMLRQQLSPHRADLTGRKLLTGHARVRRDDEVTDKDADWFMLYRPFITIERHWVTRQYQVRKEYIATSPPLFNQVLPEILYWCSLYPQDLSSLYMNTQGYPKHLLQAVLSRFIKRKWIAEKKIDGKQVFTVAGKFREGMENLFEVFGCQGVSDEEAFRRMN